MNPGLLDRRITIQKRTQSRDSLGDSIESWDNWRESIPARRTYIRSRNDAESVSGSEQRVESQKVVFTIRYLKLGDLLNPADYRIKFENKIYDISSIEEVGRRKFLDLQCVYRSTVS